MAKGPDWNDVHRATPGAVRDALTEPDIPFDDAPPAQPNGNADEEPQRGEGNGQPPPDGAAEDAPAEPDSKADKEAFARLSKLTRAGYDRVRVAEAVLLGIRIATLDKEVEALRPRIKDEAQGSDLDLYEPEPWAYPVDGAELLDEVATTVRTYAVVTIEQARTVALWIVASHAFTAFRIFPRLLIKAPNSECGKSTLKEIVGALVTKALVSDNASTAFIFRVIELRKPTLLLDEGDAFIKDDDERRGIVNSGHHKNGSVGRIVGEDLTPKTFSTYCPMVIAAIGSLPVTIENRSLIIGMVRKLPSERVTRFTDSRAEKLRDGLACKVARFAADSFEKLAKADPAIPEALSNRKGDNWRPLFAVADLAGGAWPELARAIAGGVVAGDAEDDSAPTILLSDLRDMFAALETNGSLFNEAHSKSPRRFGEELIPAQTETDRAWSRNIAVYLNSVADRPWANWNRGKGINPSDLARRLKDYGVRSKDIGIGQDHAKGYYANQLNDVFHRYLPKTESDDTDKSSNRNEYSGLSRPTHLRNKACPTLSENETLNDNNGLSGLSDSSDPNFQNPGEETHDDVFQANSDNSGEAAKGVPQPLAKQGLAAAKRGHDWLRAFWSELTTDERKAAGGWDAYAHWKLIAAQARPGQ